MRRVYVFILFVFLKICLHSQVNGQTLIPLDYNFYKVLLKDYPQTVDLEGNLIAEQASTIFGNLNCQEMGIESLEGVQYFTSISGLVAYGNAIKELPNLDGLTNLEYLHLANNQLTELPELKNFTKLSELLVYENQLTTLPDISSSRQLKIIFAYRNQLKNIPSLSSNKELTELELGGNQLESLPSLSELTKLERLLAWGNKLKQIPDLKKQVNIYELNLGNNLLESCQDLAHMKNLSVLHLDNNHLTSLPDLSSNTNLTTLILDHNKLSFEDFIGLKNLPNFATANFILFPQENLTIDVSNENTKWKEVEIKASITEEASNIYKWLKNNQLFSTTSTPYIIINTDSIGSGSTFHLEIESKHPEFANQKLFSSTLFLKAKDCIDLTKIKYHLTEYDCINGSTLIIEESSLNEGIKPFTYKLTSIGSGNEKLSKDGTFDALIDPAFRLSIATKTGCISDYQNNIEQSTDNCNQFVLTPDNDGYNESYYFEDKGQAHIYDSKGKLLRKLSIPAEWKGEDESGMITSGFYSVKVNGQKLLYFTVFY